jgi:hypothetical protein
MRRRLPCCFAHPSEKHFPFRALIWRETALIHGFRHSRHPTYFYISGYQIKNNDSLSMLDNQYVAQRKTQSKYTVSDMLLCGLMRGSSQHAIDVKLTGVTT